MTRALALIAVGLALFVAGSPSEHDYHVFALVLGIADVCLVAWSMLV